MVAGLRTPRAGVEHHNIHFGADYRGAFRDLIRRKVAMADPSVLLSVPSHTDPTLAPPGHASAYYLVPVPSLPRKVDWSPAGAKAFRRRHLRVLEAAGYPGFEDSIAVEHTTGP